METQTTTALQQPQPARPGQPGQAGPQTQEARRSRRPRRRGGPGATDPANADADFTKQPPVLPAPPAEQQKHFLLQPGYRIAPVLSDPDIKEPGAIAFDGNGRMFVLELRGYMQDADATGELDPIGRISRHEDADNDGVYETPHRLRRQARLPALRHAVRSPTAC